MKKIIKISESELLRVVRKQLEEQRTDNYMFFGNLQQMRRQIDLLLDLDEESINDLLNNGHDWADDHITVAKENLDQVFDFMMNEFEEENEFDTVNEAKKKSNRKKTGTKLCARGKSAAKAKFDVYPSAYANGYAVQVCKGKMPGLDGKKRCSGAYC
jgi:hypothetical protein